MTTNSKLNYVTLGLAFIGFSFFFYSVYLLRTTPSFDSIAGKYYENVNDGFWSLHFAYLWKWLFLVTLINTAAIFLAFNDIRLNIKRNGEKLIIKLLCWLSVIPIGLYALASAKEFYNLIGGRDICVEAIPIFIFLLPAVTVLIALYFVWWLMRRIYNGLPVASFQTMIVLLMFLVMGLVAISLVHGLLGFNVVSKFSLGACGGF